MIELEEWRDVKGYEDLYQVSNLGRVKSLKDNHGNYREKILKPGNSGRGYLQVVLSKEGESKSFLVHRLVTQAFLDNPNNYTQVNHKDENPRNNRVNNLEWCDRKYNINYGTSTQRASEKISQSHSDYKGSKNPRARKVQCITTGKKFDCIKEASEYYYVNKSSIKDCCKGKRKSAGKHPITGEKLVWKYID